MRRGGSLAVLTLVVGLLALVPSSPASAQLAGCPADFPDAQTYVWKAAVLDGNWKAFGDTVASSNWVVPAGYPRTPNEAGPPTSDPVPPGPVYACIPTAVTVRLDNTHDWFNYVQALYLAPGAKLLIGEGTGVFVNSQTVDSTAAATSQILVDKGSFGGTGTMHAHGLVRVSSADTAVSALGSNFDGGAQPYPTQSGALDIESDGTLELPSFGINLWRRYQIDIAGSATLSNNGFIALTYDSGVKVEPGGTLTFAGTGGFYEGAPTHFPHVTSLLNLGQVEKTGPATVVVGTAPGDYSEPTDPLTHIQVTGGTLAFSDGTQYAAAVDGGQTLSTAKCAVRLANQPCQVELNPAIDEQAASLTVPAASPRPAEIGVARRSVDQAEVSVDEVAPLVFFAHAVSLPLDAGPATITFRLGSGLVGTTNPALVNIDHENDAGSIPDCLGSTLPVGATNCVDRGASSYDAVHGNVLMVVRTVQTSRYVCHKVEVSPPPPPPTDHTAPQILGQNADAKGRTGPIEVAVRTDEAATLTVTGSIRVGSTLAFRTVSTQVAAGQTASLTTGFQKKLSRHQRRKLKRGHWAATLTITATDAAGNTSTKSLSVRMDR